ncbi:MAG: hypothetical protein HYU80_02150 [Candidatus Blackburnbacteria bacterium]|nr:hypothetical protein [Candidatus Blackburnbacteria bacterium]
MKTYRLNEFKGGWFVGNFLPTIIDTKECEVAVKVYKKGDFDEAHYHKLADEITVVVYGKCSINGQIYGPGDIIWLERNDVSKFEALEDSANVIVKIPSVVGDKYVVESEVAAK